MMIHVDGPVGGNAVLRRVQILRNLVKKTRQTQRTSWFKKIFWLHIYPGEFDATISPDFCFDKVEEDTDKRHYQNEVSDLQSELLQSQAKLKVAEEVISKEQSKNQDKAGVIKTAESRISNLTNRLAAAEAETTATLKQNSELKSDMKKMEAERKEEERRKEKWLGRKRIGDLCAGAVMKTKAAYKKRFVKEVNKFGKTRELTLDKMILKDKDGETLVVNAEPHRTYENLNPAEKKRVERASFLKDKNRVLDRVYALLVKDSSLPPSSHVKQHKKDLNKEVGEIFQVKYNSIFSRKQATL